MSLIKPVKLATGAECYQSADWAGTCFGDTILKHGFFTARGGVSTGLYKSLNCGFGSDDDPVLIRQNRALAATGLGFSADSMFGLRQIHSARVLDVTAETDPGEHARAEADALITCRPNIALAILTADCVPVLFAAPNAGVVGAAHAGWRGAMDGVLEATIDAMVKKGAAIAGIEAKVGPAIHQQSYQVGDDLRQAALGIDPMADQFFAPDPTNAAKRLFDLPGYVVWRLRRAGVTRVADLGVDTYHESPNLFSHRHATHANKPDSGRQISVIGWLSKTLDHPKPD